MDASTSSRRTIRCQRAAGLLASDSLRPSWLDNSYNSYNSYILYAFAHSPQEAVSSFPDLRRQSKVEHNRLSASKARERFADILNEVSVRGDRVVLERHGKTVAAVISVGDLELLEALEDNTMLTLRVKRLQSPTAGFLGRS